MLKFNKVSHNNDGLRDPGAQLHNPCLRNPYLHYLRVQSPMQTKYFSFWLSTHLLLPSLDYPPQEAQQCPWLLSQITATTQVPAMTPPSFQMKGFQTMGSTPSCPTTNQVCPLGQPCCSHDWSREGNRHTTMKRTKPWCGRGDQRQRHLPQAWCGFHKAAVHRKGRGGTGDEEEGEWEGWSPLFCF